ncbi:PDZ domain-containing protein [Geomonas sp. Red32]|uniref:S41 family peptidase n=1 Tax=Geomonas sp. Red32 TaxID=2912856 RepID=UPI00202CDEE7|nr:PDZ domain-containing protein [Geomonas sp. Red32]MCM0082772.1 PDZ domain-containing protein [Geomonas sp. Red32]
MMKTFFAMVVFLLLAAAPLWGANSSVYFGGVGIDGVPRADGSIVVRQLVQGGPAQQGGIHVNDVITHIDGAATQGSNFKDMVEHRLRGKAGTAVLLKVRRPGNPKVLTFKLVRRQLALPGSKVNKAR